MVNEGLCYIRDVRNTFTSRPINEVLINLFNNQELLEAFHLYHDHQGKNGHDFKGKDHRENGKVHHGMDDGRLE